MCLYTIRGQVYNVAEDIDRYTCANDDPRAYDKGLDCKTKIANDTFDCYSGCSGTPKLTEGLSYELAPDRRCTYRVDFWDKRGI